MRITNRWGMAVGVCAGVVIALVLIACTTALCGCGGGQDDGQGEPFDFYATHYAACVDACDAAGSYARACGLAPVDEMKCVDAAWHWGMEPHECEEASHCHATLTADADCRFKALVEAGMPKRYEPCPAGEP